MKFNEPFFIFKDGSNIKHSHVRLTLRKLLNNININSSLYNTSSFRSGRAVDLLHYGYTIEQIQRAGRWKFNAVYRYLKN